MRMPASFVFMLLEELDRAATASGHGAAPSRPASKPERMRTVEH